MTLKTIKGKPDYARIINLINAEWPAEFGELDDCGKIQEMNKSHNEQTDTVKYLVDNDTVIGFYRYSLWPRNKKNTKTAHTLDIAIIPDKQQ